MSREEALNLPGWEFDQYREFFYQQKARDTLSHYQATGMAFGGSKEDTKTFLEDLRERAGYNNKRLATVESDNKAKYEQARKVLQGAFGIISAEEYKARLKAGSSGGLLPIGDKRLNSGAVKVDKVEKSEGIREEMSEE